MKNNVKLKDQEFLGVVLDNEDSNNLDQKRAGRYRVHMPDLMHHMDSTKGIWVKNHSHKWRMSASKYGEYGQYFPIQPDTKVIIKFTEEDINSGYIDRIVSDFFDETDVLAQDCTEVKTELLDRDEQYIIFKTPKLWNIFYVNEETEKEPNTIYLIYNRDKESTYTERDVEGKRNRRTVFRIDETGIQFWTADNQRIRIKLDDNKQVDGNQTEYVGGFSTKHVKKDLDIHVHKDRRQTVDNNDDLWVRGERTKNIDKDDIEHIVGISRTLIDSDRHEIINKNEYVLINVDQHKHVVGNRTLNVDSNQDETIKGKDTKTVQGTRDKHISGLNTETYDSENNIHYKSNNINTIEGNNEVHIKGKNVLSVAGASDITSVGNMTETINGSSNKFISGEYVQTVNGNTNFYSSNFIIEVGGSCNITSKGACSINSSSAVTISAPMINLNSMPAPRIPAKKSSKAKPPTPAKDASDAKNATDAIYPTDKSTPKVDMSYESTVKESNTESEVTDSNHRYNRNWTPDGFKHADLAKAKTLVRDLGPEETKEYDLEDEYSGSDIDKKERYQVVGEKCDDVTKEYNIEHRESLTGDKYYEE